MRKHFLLLFLMALLPLAGWAIDLTGAAVTFDPVATTTPYDGASHDLPTVTVATATGNLTVQWFYNEETTPLTTLKYKDAGTYTCKVTSDNDTGEATATFTVTRLEVDVTAKAITTGVTYGDEVSVVTALGDYTIDLNDIVAADKETVSGKTQIKSGVISGSVTGYTTTYTKGTAVSATPTITPIITGLTAANYTFKANAANVTIAQKALTTDMIKSVGNFTAYTGVSQLPTTITMRDDAISTTVNLEATTDYTFQVKAGSPLAVVTAATDAGTYTVEVTGAGNYKGTVSTTFTIAKAPLLIQTKGDGTSANYKKVYDGTLTTWAAGDDVENYLDVQGYVDGGFNYSNANLQLSIIPVSGGTGSTDGNAGAYKLKIAPIAGKSWSTLFPNYQVTNLNNGNYTITKLEYGFAVTNQYLSFDEENPFANNIEDAKDYITVAEHTPAYALPAGFAVATYPTLKGVTVTTKGTYDLEMIANTVVIKNGTTTEAVDKTANFDIKLTKGTLTVAGGVIAVIPQAMSFTYGDATPAPEFELAGLRDSESAADIAALETVVKKYISYSDGLDAGTHANKIIVDAAKILAELPDGLKANYESVSPFTATYTIAQRALTKITVAAQSLNVGNTVADLEKSAETVTFEANGYTLTEDDYEKLMTEYNFVFKDGLAWTAAEITTATEAYTTDNVATMSDDNQATWLAAHPAYGKTAGALKAEGTTNDGIRIAFVGTAFTNFSLPTGVASLNAAVASKYILGKLTVSAAADLAALTDLGTGANLPATLLAASKGKKVDNVKITLNRNQAVGSYNDAWEAKKWNALILPFDITVEELADVIGYCIVNVASGNSTDDKVSFKLEMDNIPANTPFMVKTTKKIVAGTQWNFGTKTIADYTYATDPSVDAGNDNKFVGTYKGVTIDKNNTNWRWNAGSSWPHFGSSSASSYIVRPFCAYMQIAEANAARDIVFEFEELDGTTTAINSIDADFAVINAKGWYTINGVKLQGAPTEKGIYINNGKKVVIK